MVGTHYHQCWNGEKAKCNLCIGVNFLVWVNFVPQDNCPRVEIVVGANFVIPGQNPWGHVPEDSPVSFRSPGKLLTTLDTLLRRKIPCEMSLDKLVLLYLLWYIFYEFVKNSAYVMVCFLHTSSVRPRSLSQHVLGDAGPVWTHSVI